MEVRCGNCHKLFRVSDDKISGKGIKFVCTRCGKYVKITIEDFSTYTLSKTAVSALDLFEQKAATSEIGLTVTETAGTAKTPESMAQEKTAGEPTTDTIVGEDFLKSAIPDFLRENGEPTPTSRSPFGKSTYQTGPHTENKLESATQAESESGKSDIAQPELEKMPEPQPGAETMTMKVEMPGSESGMTPTGTIREDALSAFEQQPEQEPKTETAEIQTAMTEPEAGVAGVDQTIEEVQRAPEQMPEPQLEPEQQTEHQQEAKKEITAEPAATAPEPKPVSANTSETSGSTQREQKPELETKDAVISAVLVQPTIRPEPKATAIPDARPQTAQNITRPETESHPTSRPKPAVVPTAKAYKKESSHRPSPVTSPVVGAPPDESPQSGKKAMLIVAAVTILVLGGLGAYMFMRSPEPSSKEPTAHMISTEGLRIVNAAGVLDPNTDLVISGVIENSTDKPQPAWLVVVDVYDAKGTEISKIKLLNGKQLYSRRDYDILAKRGVPVQELKAKAVQGQGAIIPPRDKVTFEIRYLEPPADIASFNATLQPFDPEQLSKEVEYQVK